MTTGIMTEREQVAVIDIGSSAIRLLIAEPHPDGNWRVMESASRPVRLGQDVFRTGRISRETIRQSIRILTGFRELIDSYQVHTIRTIGTSAVREAENRDIFIDRIRMRTGVDVKVIAGIEANHLTYMAVRNALGDSQLAFSHSDTMIMEVGAGSTEIMILRHGKMVSAHTLNIGAVRMEQNIGTNIGTPRHLSKVLRDRIGNALDILRAETPLDGIELFIGVGGDVRVAAKHVGQEREGGRYAVIEEADFQGLVRDLTDLSLDEMVRRLHISYDEADTLLPALLVYSVFVQPTAASRLVVPHVSIRDGVLLDISESTRPDAHAEFYEQVTASTRSLGRKYHFGEEHARHVTDLALRLFDELQDLHGLGTKERLLLEVAGMLHDIGIYINFSSHHKHSAYIISASDIFGLHPDDVELVANTVRYHRKAQPRDSHLEYKALAPDVRIVVAKLAAILRVADAMDRGHQQRIKQFELERTEEELIVHCINAGDISLEQLGIEYKADMFGDVFGLSIVLV